jgi:hypothetical protein
MENTKAPTIKGAGERNTLIFRLIYIRIWSNQRRLKDLTCQVDIGNQDEMTVQQV